MARGGGLSWDRVRRFLRNTLRERSTTYVTTFFDLYALDTDFPGTAAAQRIADPLVRATHLERCMHEARLAAQSPEHINDGAHTHPSARLQGLQPRYIKPLHGVALIERIGLDRIRAECAHFNAWLSRLETLVPLDFHT